MFIRDYVQVRLERPSESLELTFVDDPTVLDDNGWTTRKMPGWRDRLCGFIGQTIETAEIDETRMLLGLSGGSLEARFGHESGPESVRLDCGDRWWVW